MNNFCVPPSPAWYTSPVCSPENGLLYIAGNHTSIAYIPPSEKSMKNGQSQSNQDDNNRNAQKIRIIQTHNQFKSIDCDPNWTTSKWFVTMNEQNIIWVWNLETEKLCRGHKAHATNGNDGRNDSDSPLGGAMCITKSRQVLSIDRNAFVRYCLVSNTYSIFPDNFILKRGTVSVLKTSPYNQDIIAIGYKNGLIVLANYAETVVLHKLRGHDSEIVSLQWTSIEPLPPPKETKAVIHTEPETIETVEKTPTKNVAPRTSSSKPKVDKVTEKKPTRREAPKPIVDAGDMFDIHSYDYLEEEFGTITSSARTPKHESHVKSNTNNENFNFVEECQTLREQIRAGNQSDSDDSYGYSATKEQSAVNMTDIRNMMKTRSPVQDGSIELSDTVESPAECDELSNRSTIGSSHNTTEIAELEDVIKDLNIDDETVHKPLGVIYLASGAQESCVVVWNAETGAISDKIEFKSQGRSKIPKPNCSLVWIRSNEFVVNGPDGRISTWKASTEGNGKKATEYPDTAVINIGSNVEYNPSEPIVYTSSTYLSIVGHKFHDGSSEIISKYATLPIGMLALRVCPHDPNKIAIAGNNKRINILDLSTLKRDNVEIQSLTSKIQGKVLALAWHPTNENLLSFSTNEGRVGVFNISKNTSAPDLMKNFNDKDLYSLSYSVDAETKKCLLFASNHDKLMMFDDNSTKNDNHKILEFSIPISSVGASENYIALGFSDGMLKILTNNQEKAELFSEVVSKKYFTEISFSTLDPKKIAASSDKKIFILQDDGNGFKQMGELTGHQSLVTSVSWSSQSEHKLVSASFDHTVRVWDAQTMECIAWSSYENKMHCAVFLPTDENFIVCSGISETMHIFEIQKRLVADVGVFDNKKKKISATSEVQWGTLYQNEASKQRLQEKKRLRKLEKKAAENVDEIADTLNSVKLSSDSTKLNYTTILYLTNKELNKDPLDHLQRLLVESVAAKDCKGDAEESDYEFLHGKLFGDREHVTELLNDELKNHKNSKTESIGNLLIPQINFELKANIIQSIEERRLTEQQISLAPSISYEFWKNCCLAYANQCIEQGVILKAIPHLLVIQQVNEAIEKLCDAHFYREAWCIAKMYKEPEEKIFETIAEKWFRHLEAMGNLEGAALISYLSGNEEISYEILNKRESKTPQIEEILNILSQKVNN